MVKADHTAHARAWIGGGFLLTLVQTNVASAADPVSAPLNLPLWLGAGFLLLVIAFLVVLSKRSNILCDAQPSDFGGALSASGQALERPFSLARTQMAWWFILVLIGYIYIFMVTGEINSLNDTTLILMGIGTGTALGAAAIENSKANPTQDQFDALVAQIVNPVTPPADIPALIAARDQLARKLASTNFFNDILTDAHGISLHRFQSVVWNVALGLIFLFKIVQMKTPVFPDFGTAELATLGISAGAYLGLKVPEQPS